MTERRPTLHTHRAMVQHANNRARLLSLPATLTLEDWLEILAQAGGRCVYCHETVGPRLTLDHAIPLSRGGASSRENVVAACDACNRAKNGRTPEEFLSGTRQALAMPAALTSTADETVTGSAERAAVAAAWQHHQLAPRLRAAYARGVARDADAAAAAYLRQKYAAEWDQYRQVYRATYARTEAELLRSPTSADSAR